MSTELRKIIVNATSEMLDSPDEHGIYPTTRFYERLESEVEEYIQMHPDPINVHELVLKTVENSANMGVPLQAAAARYLEYLSTPVMTTSRIAESLFGKDKE